jgi:hypothetical protein
MFRNKQKNQYGTFQVNRGYKKIIRILVAALLAVIFVLAFSIFLYKKANKPVKMAETQVSVPDQIPGWWYQQYFGSSVCDKDACKPDADPDRDGLSNAQEFYYHTDPLKNHTVGDKLSDGQLVAQGFDPSRAGRMRFEQVASDENILGESLVFNSDIKNLINESVNPPNLKLPTVNESGLIIENDSKQSFATYSKAATDTVNSHFPSDKMTYITNAMQSRDYARISDIQTRLTAAVSDLKKVPVPKTFLQLHKYAIAYLDLLSQVTQVPDQTALSDDTNVEGNIWFDKMQALMQLYQRITLETKRLESSKQ